MSGNNCCKSVESTMVEEVSLRRLVKLMGNRGTAIWMTLPPRAIRRKRAVGIEIGGGNSQTEAMAEQISLSVGACGLARLMMGGAGSVLRARRPRTSAA